MTRQIVTTGLIIIALALTFMLYLRPEFLVDLSNSVIAWCG